MSKYFITGELTRSAKANQLGIDNTPTPDITKRLNDLMDMLDTIREAYGSPISVTSGYRCPELNKAVKGSKTSQHLKGEAADLVPCDFDTLRLFNVIKALVDKGELVVGQLIWEKGKKKPVWVHVSLPTQRLRNQVLRIG